MADKTYVLLDDVIAHIASCERSNMLPVECSAITLIKNIPAADVVELKKGKWVKSKESWFTPGGDPVWECSECGKGRHVYGVEHGSYSSDVADGQWVSCPNCGAIMEGDAE